MCEVTYHYGLDRHTRTRITLCTRVTYGTSENTWSSIAAGYISIPGGEGQFVPVIWRVHWDSLTVIQSLATLFLFPLSPLLSLLPFAPSSSILVTTLLCSNNSPIRSSLSLLQSWPSDATTAPNCARILPLQVQSRTYIHIGYTYYGN